MSDLEAWTEYDDVNAVVAWFLTRTRALLGTEFVGMYLYGSLALGDFDPVNSDIDFVVVTESMLEPRAIDALRDIHAAFDQSGSSRVGRIEAVYSDRAGMRTFPTTNTAYPQVETNRTLLIEPLEMGWIFQCHTLRRCGVVVAGPPPTTLIPPLDPDAIRRAAAPIARMWQRVAIEDPDWLPWLRERDAQSFVVLTLCRILYTVERADVASKPGAARWAQQFLDDSWSPLIANALTGKYARDTISATEERQTLALIDYTVERFRDYPDLLT